MQLASVARSREFSHENTRTDSDRTDDATAAYGTERTSPIGLKALTGGATAIFFGGMLIFPLNILVLRILGGPTALPKGHPSAALAMQRAFTVPLGLLSAVALGSYEPVFFFPAALIIVEAHYLVSISLYGMRLRQRQTTAKSR